MGGPFEPAQLSQGDSNVFSIFFIKIKLKLVKVKVFFYFSALALLEDGGSTCDPAQLSQGDFNPPLRLLLLQ